MKSYMGFTVSYNYGDDVKNIITQMLCVAFRPILVSVMAMGLDSERRRRQQSSRRKLSKPEMNMMIW